MAKTHGMHNTPTYRSWHSMQARCRYPSMPSYPKYGGRGIKVCERWARFENFLADMGVRPEGKSIDRIDNDGDYGPDNCRWATASEQQQNKRRFFKGDFCKSGHEYTVDGVYINSRGARQCKPCNIRTARESRERKRDATRSLD
jgi:hypothetical protein